MVLHPTLVLDLRYLPVAVFSHKKAFLLELLNRCEVLEHYTTIYLHSPSKSYPAPLVIRIPVLSKHWQTVSPTRRAVFTRDNFRCAYCGRVLKDNEITIDHVIPKSRGGQWRWENLVTCCISCNQKKGGRTPQEAGMKLLFKPKKPSGFEISLNRWKKRINDEFTEMLKLYCGIELETPRTGGM